MTTAVLLDHVSAYTAAVRCHLRDLSREQVEDLTDGLEADLVEALEDREGPVVTGEIPIGRAASAAGIPAPPGSAPEASMIDLTRRFGPAAAYAAELRAAAGLEPGSGPRPVGPRPFQRVTDRLAGRLLRWRDAVAPALTTPVGRAIASFMVSLRPLWWVVRGWVWFALIMGVLRYVMLLGFSNLERFVPRTAFAWLVLITTTLISVGVGRGMGRDRPWVRVVTTVLSLIALVAAPAVVTQFGQEIERRTSAQAYLDYSLENREVPFEVPMPVVDGVYVDGMLVSNLFVYDADGNPLERVQIFDDRGRPVRTTYDDGSGAWSLPGVVDPWVFSSDTTVDGRARWNVYPLLGVPFGEMGDSGDGAEPSDAPEPRTPPRPFEKAPALVGADDGGAAG